MPRDHLPLTELLELAEDARAYKDAAEQWAVNAVMALRAAIAEEDYRRRKTDEAARRPEAHTIKWVEL